MVIKLSEEIYPKESILKAAYKFSADYQIYLDKKGGYYLLEVETADGNSISDPGLEHEIRKELLAQAARHAVVQQTQELRNIIVARALASTIIDDHDGGYVSEEDMKAEDILTDWFDKYDE